MMNRIVDFRSRDDEPPLTASSLFLAVKTNEIPRLYYRNSNTQPYPVGFARHCSVNNNNK
jgi:hypothetical protein